MSQTVLGLLEEIKDVGTIVYKKDLRIQLPFRASKTFSDIKIKKKHLDTKFYANYLRFTDFPFVMNHPVWYFAEQPKIPIFYQTPQQTAQ